MRDPEALARRYADGLTLRAIGAELGISHQAVRYHLLKLPGYRSLVTRMLLKRLRQAQRAFGITPAGAREERRQRRRRLKHCLAMLRQKRPAIYARWIAREAPALPGAERWGKEYRADCPECRSAGAVWARRRGNAWHWHCTACDGRGALRAR